MSKRRANIERQALKICSISWRRPDRSPTARLSSSLGTSDGRTASTLNRLARESETIREEESMPRSNNRTRKDQNDWSVMEMARERPLAAAAAAASAAAAGLFLWSKRSQISEQINNLSDQIGEWTDSIGSGASRRTDDTARLTTRSASMRSGAGSRSASGTLKSGARKRGGGGVRTSGTRKMDETSALNAEPGSQ
jgi:hypothetical protein